MCLKAVEAKLGIEKTLVFKKRYAEDWDLNHDQLYNCYKTIKKMMENPVCETPTSSQEAPPMNDASSVLDDLMDYSVNISLNSTVASVNPMSSTSGLQNAVPSTALNSGGEASLTPMPSTSGLQSPVANTSLNSGGEVSVDPMPSTSVLQNAVPNAALNSGEVSFNSMPLTSGLQNPVANISVVSVPSTSGLQNHPRFSCSSPTHSLPDLTNTPSNPHFYGNWEFSPFKKYLKIDDRVVIARKEAKSKPSHPPAVSGEDYYKNLLQKQKDKQMQLDKKKERQELREKKKNEKGQKNKKNSKKNTVTEEEEISYADDSDEEVSFEEADECQACGGDSNKEDDNAWIGCNNCPRWFHRDCLAINFDNI